MRFYNREKELGILEALNKVAENRTTLCVLTGVRRVGKTELIKQFFKKHGGSYFFVDPTKTSRQLLQEFTEIVKEDLGLSPLLKPTNWDEFLQLIFSAATEKKVIIAFDEFQRFLKVEKQVPFRLQRMFDLEKNNSKLLILVAGSSVGLIRKLFLEGGAPLLGRADNVITLKPFSFKDSIKILNDLGVSNFQDKIEIYSCFGGLPNIHELMEAHGAKTLEETVDTLVFSEHAPLGSEVHEILTEEFGKETPTYYAILAAIAEGRTKQNEIADYAGLKTTSMNPYFYDLIELVGAIKKEAPIGDSEKKSRYFLANNFFRFWFKFVYKRKSDYNSEKYQSLKKRFMQEKDSFIGLSFEDVCKEAMELLNNNIVNFDRIGRYWNKQVEIDLLALGKKEVYIVECKWQKSPFRLSDIKNLEAKAADLFRPSKKKFVVFSKAGFDEEALSFGKQNGWRLFNLKDLENLFTHQK